MKEKTIAQEPWFGAWQRTAKGFELEFPDSLVALYKHCKGIDQPWGDGVAAEQTSAKVWAAICVRVYGKLRERAEMSGRTGTYDLVQGFVESLFCGSCPDEITSAGILISRANKYAMLQVDPCGYEINTVLRRALRELVSDCRLCRSEPEKTITASTRFWLSGCDAVRVATPEECAEEYEALPKVGNAGEKRQMLTCSEAKKLMVALLQSMGGGVAIAASDLMACVRSRTRNVFSITSCEMDHDGRSKDGEDDSQQACVDIRNDVDRDAVAAMLDEAEGVLAGKNGPDNHGTNDVATSDDSASELSFQEMQLRQLSSGLAREMFDCVLKIEDGVRILALYTLPELYRKGCDKSIGTKKSITACDLGDFRKVSAANKRIRDKLQDLFETRIGRRLRMRGDSCVSGRDVAKLALKKICRLCAENGYPVILK